MGGGASTAAAKEHLKKGLRIISLKKPALTFNDNIEKVKGMGIEIVDKIDCSDCIEMKDVFLDEFVSFFQKVNVSLPDKIFVAVQDHGFSPHMSNRKFRFSVFQDQIKKERMIYSFFYNEKNVPSYFNRMRSVVDSIRDFSRKSGMNIQSYVIDTVFAAILGAMLDVRRFPAFVLNFGNSHTTGAVVDEDGFVHSLFEHHTSVMRRKGYEGIKSFLDAFLKGKITNEDVFEDGGHGAYIRDVVDVRDVVATGPNVHLCSFRVANPAGDTMIAGNLGMIRAYCQVNGIDFEVSGLQKS